VNRILQRFYSITVDLKLIDVIDKKQMYDSVTMTKGNASED